MIRLICTIALAVSSCSSSPPTQLADRIAVFVGTQAGFGSGFPLTDTEIITAWHVVNGMPPEGILVNGQHPITTERLGELDAAVLTFAEPHGLEPWPLDVRLIEPAESVYCSGWGSGLHWWSVGLGTISPDRLSLLIAPGDSGGPILDADFDVVAIVVAIGAYGQHHCWIVPITEITEQLELRSQRLDALLEAVNQIPDFALECD